MRLQLAVALALVACGGSGQQTAAPLPASPPPPPVAVGADGRVSTADYEGVIFAGRWTPTGADIAALEAAMPAYIRARATRRHADSILPRLPSYKRQYTGVVREGVKLVSVNAFCSDGHGVDWLHQLVLVDGGGSCYFGLEWDPLAGAFTSIYVNADE